jgi:Fe-S cluster biogenesis protein NfuA
MSTVKDINISAQVTPNPDTLKFMVEKTMVETGTYNFVSKEDAKGSYLPESLFGINGVEGVMVGAHFISVTKNSKIEWVELVESITDLIKEILISGNDLIDASGEVQHEESGTASAIETKIKHILDTEIRPAVAMDGGDITFHSYVDGILTLHLQGACSSCPASTMTLKMGIENRLKEDIPELVEVIQV